jgi:hypothetical protein
MVSFCTMVEVATSDICRLASVCGGLKLKRRKKKKKKPELRGDGLASSVVISRKDAKTGRGGDADVGRVNRKVRRSSGGSDADVKAR